jgi:hypothetical protein
MAAATDEAVMPVSTVEKRWDTTTPLAWSNKNKNKNKTNNKNKNKNKNKTKTKTKTKSTSVAATSPPLCLQTATPVLPPLLPLCK